jgi:peptidoglycan/xylan/chitin deacetylase (PgdA/CDA1 family)
MANMKATSAAVTAGVACGLAVVGTALAQLLPATSSLRWARNRWMPGLAGLGTQRHVALTFDDGPDETSTPAFLDTLDELGWRATFFMLGEMAARSPEVAREVARRGHEVAVHGYRHSNHLRRGPRWAARDLLTARQMIGQLTETELRWFRPPYGALSASTLAAARKVGLQPVLWSTWGHDWQRGATAESVSGDVWATLVPGATVLLHDSDCTSAPGSWKATLGALPLLAERWRAAGLSVGPLREHGLKATGTPISQGSAKRTKSLQPHPSSHERGQGHHHRDETPSL